MQDWTIDTAIEVVVVDDDGTIYGPYENECHAYEEWEKVTDHKWEVRSLNRMVDFREDEYPATYLGAHHLEVRA